MIQERDNALLSNGHNTSWTIEIDVDFYPHVILTNIYTTRTLYVRYELFICTGLVYYIPYIGGDIFVECRHSSKLICSHSYN